MEEYKDYAEKLPAENAILVHGTAFSVDGRGVLIMAPSGVGKSTQMQFWMEILKDRFCVINDDKPILKLIDDRVVIETSPLCGKEGLKSNHSAELFSVIFLDGSKDWNPPEIALMDSGKALDYIVKQVYIPEEFEMRIKTLDLIDSIFTKTSLYVLKRNKTRECARIAINKIFGNIE